MTSNASSAAERVQRAKEAHRAAVAKVVAARSDEVQAYRELAAAQAQWERAQWEREFFSVSRLAEGKPLLPDPVG
jgi:hypothetical protein